jgi:hypothetical protein
MSTRDDPLAKLTVSPDRVFYATGILLDAQDFDAEQTYHRSRLARSLAYLHGSGTVAGLEVVPETAGEEQLAVKPGIAIDRLGRLIEIPRQACIRLQRWFDDNKQITDDDLKQSLYGEPYNGIVVDVFLRFVACERGKTPAFASGPFDALDAVTPSRLRDGYELSLVIRKDLELPLPVGAPPLTERDPRLKLPQNPWPDLSAIADLNARRTTLNQAIFNAWREGTEQWDRNGHPVPLPEHTERQDTTALFLARVVLPATAGTNGGRPVRSQVPITADNINNQLRSFVYTAGALARWIGV